jgi:uncharacterized protein (DUF697 family)
MSQQESIEISGKKIIRNHMAWSMGAGLIPLPLVDFFAVGAIQLDMIRQLCKLYDVPFKEKDVKAIISSLTGAGSARLGANLIKFIPGVGSVIGGVTMSVLSGASTYAVGELFKSHLETGGTILDFDGTSLKRMYDELFEKGKDIAKEMESNKSESVDEENVTKEDTIPVEDKIQKIKELGQMLEQGLITQSEYISLKKSVLGSME